MDTMRHFTKPVSCLAFSQIGDLLLACSVDRQIKFYNVKYRRITHQMSGGHSETINACAFCYSQPLALTASSDRTIKVWDANSGSQKGKMGCSSGIYSLDIAMSDSIAGSGHRDGSLRFWSIRDNTLIHEVKGVHDDVVSSINYMPYDSNTVVTSSRDHTVKLVDVRMLKVVKTYEHENYYNTSDTSQIGVSPAGRYLALGSKNGKLIVIDLQREGAVEDSFDKQHQGCPIVSVDWSRRTSRLASVDQKGNIFVWS